MAATTEMLEEKLGTIRFISTTTVKPTTQNESSHRIELTPWDLRLLLIGYIQKGLLFYKPEQLQMATLIHHLKASLSHTLDIFYPLAGRLSMVQNEDDNTTSFFINCNGIGALFVHAVADGVSVSDILEPIFVPDIVNSFFLSNGDLDLEGISKPLLSLQVTELVDGIFIGCSANHSVVDGFSFWHFFNTWSDISRNSGYKSSQPLPIFERSYFKDIVGFPVRITNSPYNEILDPKITDLSDLKQRVFHFKKEKIAELKKRSNTEMGTNNISSLQVLLALLWRSVNQAKCLPDDQVVSYLVAVGLRSRLNPPLPEHYAGNAVQGQVASLTVGELLKNRIGWVALKINEVITNQTGEVRKLASFEDWVQSPRWVRFNMTNMLLTGSSPRFNVYGNDFGWGKPIAVRSGVANKYDGKLTVFPGVQEGSIDFEACLSVETLEAMAGDSELMEALTL